MTVTEQWDECFKQNGEALVTEEQYKRVKALERLANVCIEERGHMPGWMWETIKDDIMDAHDPGDE